MSEVHMTSTITPAEGKSNRVREILSNLAKDVASNEAGAIQYHVFEQVKSENIPNVFIVHETYKDQASFEAHFVTSYVKVVMETIGAENLFANEADMKICKHIAGYESR